MLSGIHKVTAPLRTLADTDRDRSMRRSLCDCAGAVCSCACAVHCAAMPFVIGWLPSLGLTWLVDDGFHQWMVAVCFMLAVAAVLPGYLRHRRLLVPLLAVAGVSVLAVGAFVMRHECCQQFLAVPVDSSTLISSASVNECGTASQESCRRSGSGIPACCEHSGHEPHQDFSTRAASHPFIVARQNELKMMNAGSSLAEFTGPELPNGEDWLQWLTRLLTPLGGILLVIAHLMNRRNCDCCKRPT